MPDDIGGMAKALSFLKNSSQLNCSSLPTQFLAEKHTQNKMSATAELNQK